LGNSLGYWDLNQAAWTEDSEHVFVTNVFLSLNGMSEEDRLNAKTPCRVVEVTVRSGDARCVVFTTLDKQGSNVPPAAPLLQNVRVSVHDSQLRVLFNDFQGSTRTDLYRLEHGKWVFTESLVNAISNSQGALDAKNVSSNSRPSHTHIVVEQSLNVAPSLWALDDDSGRSKEIWNPNPWLSKEMLGKVSIYRWTDPSGYKWIGGLVLPPDFVAGKRYPLVIQTHGFEETEFMSAGEFTTAMAARPLASAGIIVLQVRDRRDHHDTLQEATDQIRGYQAAIGTLSEAGLVDPKRVGIVGFSRTCWHVEAALAEFPQLFSAGVVADGEDLGYMQYMLFAPESTYIQKGATGVIGSPPFGEGLKAWMSNVPDFKLDRVLTPLRIEALGPGSLLQEWELYSSLHLQDKPVDLIYLPGGEHVLIKPRERVVSEQGTVDWFRFWFQGYEDPNPAKTDQYKRWEHLRDLRDADARGAGQAQDNASKLN
jgi:dipeptidyl aminopeptidase/acylaminoacyl peptidase